MAFDQIDVGEPVELAAFFVDSGGTPVNPTTIALLITAPDGTTITKAKADMSNPATGDFRYTQTATMAGVWTHLWTPSNGAIQEEFFLVAASAQDGPCDPWIGPQDLFDCDPLDDVAEGSRNYGLASDCAAAASRILYVMEGRSYPGICRSTIRPCFRSWGWCGCGALTGPACRCGSGSRISEFLLSPDFPVLGVQRVLVDGATVSSALYRVDDDQWLVRTDGTPWPSVNDLSLATTEVGTWGVTFFWGRAAPPDGLLGAAALAAELYRACSGGECGLPDRVSSRVIQGVTVDFISPDDFADGKIGVRAADLFLEAARASKSNQRTTVVSPDLVGGYRRTG